MWHVILSDEAQARWLWPVNKCTRAPIYQVVRCPTTISTDQNAELLVLNYLIALNVIGILVAVLMRCEFQFRACIHQQDIVLLV